MDSLRVLCSFFIGKFCLFGSGSLDALAKAYCRWVLRKRKKVPVVKNWARVRYIDEFYLGILLWICVVPYRDLAVVFF